MSGFREECRKLKNQLERLGVSSISSEQIIAKRLHCTVDFTDERIRTLLKQIYREAPESHLKHVTTGSADFTEQKIVAEVPFPFGREKPTHPTLLKVGDIKPPEKCRITEVHITSWDDLPVAHVHLECEEVKSEKVLNMISDARKIAEYLLEKPRF